jgi:hypothetical protein
MFHDRLEIEKGVPEAQFLKSFRHHDLQNSEEFRQKFEEMRNQLRSINKSD